MPPVIGTSSARHASPMPGDGFRELPHDLRPLGIAEVQAVGRADRQRRRRTRRCAPPRPRPAARPAADRARRSARCRRPTSPARAACPSRARRRRSRPRARSCSSAPCGRTGGRSSACWRSSATPAASATRRSAAAAAAQLVARNLLQRRRDRPAPAIGRVIHRRLVGQRAIRHFGDDHAVVLDAQQVVRRSPRRCARRADPTSRRCARLPPRGRA